MRIRGTIGKWPVDLTIELDPQEWAQLARPAEQLPASTPQPAAAVPPAAAKDDGPWRVACELLRTAGRMEGPELLEHLQGLTGDFGAAKRLLVRLRHHRQVRVFSEGETPVYVWQAVEKA
ncbi:hypothetical protein [Pseudomonas sp. KCJK9111]|uniref:hypothetical protein n=1 Tax=Pseudomonas sp. KCJK9111 TaxID=3344555 RepID=UPI00390615DB